MRWPSANQARRRAIPSFLFLMYFLGMRRSKVGNRCPQATHSRQRRTPPPMFLAPPLLVLVSPQRGQGTPAGIFSGGNGSSIALRALQPPDIVRDLSCPAHCPTRRQPTFYHTRQRKADRAQVRDADRDLDPWHCPKFGHLDLGHWSPEPELLLHQEHGGPGEPVPIRHSRTARMYVRP